ncbi:MAG: hypothetical protein HYX69_13640 [Planctomycetia bacterium]|nr:hypothetical protein [Planctomycetia bacterium]
MSTSSADRERKTLPGKPWGRAARWAASAVILWHLAAVLVGPLSLPPTMLTDRIGPIFRPYLSATYLNHAYKFFAPDPGPSHLVRYELEMPDGTKTAGVFPSLTDEWPRLFYHRHFMLSEFINIAPPDPSWTPQMDWTRLPFTQGQQQYARSYGDHMLHKYRAKRVNLWLQEHLIPTPDQVAKGMRLDDRTLYRERKLGTFVEMP